VVAGAANVSCGASVTSGVSATSSAVSPPQATATIESIIKITMKA
jgi:hypothetical protein